MSRILITGGTGNVGSEVVNKLNDHAADIRLALRNPTNVGGSNHEKVAFDFKNPDTFESSFRDVDKLFLMRPPAISKVEKYIFPAIDKAEKSGVQHVVFLSLQGAEGNKIVPHHKIEQYLKKSSMLWTFLRPSFFMQNLNTTHQKEIREDNALFVPAGSGKTSFIDVRDIASVAALALTEDGHLNKAYELTGTKALSYNEVADAFSEVLNRAIQYENPSILRFVFRMMKRGEKLSFALVMVALYTTVRFGMAEHVTDTVEQLLGRPPIKLEEYVADYKGCWE